MRRRLAIVLSGLLLVAGPAGCYGGDSSPEDAAGGGVPVQGDVTPRQNVGQSDGYPDFDSGQEALRDETTDP